MNYLKKTKEGVEIYPYSVLDLKKEFPFTSFPQELDDQLLQAFDIHPVHDIELPKSVTVKFVEQAPVLIEGKYFRNFSEVVLDETEQLNVKNGELENIRARRNQLLKETDFTMLEDFPQRGSRLQEWKQYRQALRDITQQPDVFNINWPVQPI